MNTIRVPPLEPAEPQAEQLAEQLVVLQDGQLVGQQEQLPPVQQRDRAGYSMKLRQDSQYQPQASLRCCHDTHDVCDKAEAGMVCTDDMGDSPLRDIREVRQMPKKKRYSSGLK